MNDGLETMNGFDGHVSRFPGRIDLLARGDMHPQTKRAMNGANRTFAFGGPNDCIKCRLLDRACGLERRQEAMIHGRLARVIQRQPPRGLPTMSVALFCTIGIVEWVPGIGAKG